MPILESGPEDTLRERSGGRAASRDAALGELFVRLADGDLTALDRIWELAGDDLYGLALWRLRSPSDAEDAVQDTFVRLARAAPRLGDVRKPFGYLLRVLHRITIDIVRRRRPHEDLETAPDLPWVEADAEQRAEAARLSMHLNQLPPEQREAVYLREILGMKLREVGAVSGVSTFTAASRHRLAMRRLRQLMGVPA